MGAFQAEAISHPISAILAILLVVRRGGHWAGPAFLGLMLGWGSLPLLLMLTRELRPDYRSGDRGFNPSEPAEAGSDWDEWRSYYFNLRQDLVIQVFQLVIVLFYLVFLATMWLAPDLLGPVLIGVFNNRSLAFALWVFGVLWPSLLGLWLVSGHWWPWLGTVWRFADEIWRSSGLVAPAEVNFRHPGGATVGQEQARVELLEAVARTHQLHQLTLFFWLVLGGVFAASIALCANSL